MILKAQHPHNEGAVHSESPHEHKNKAIDVPLVSAHVYSLSALRRNCAWNANRILSV